jgi:uncharacterized repeat protein (TIGR03803 family)
MRRLKSEICRISGVDLWMMVAASVLAALMIVAATEAQAQSFQVLHNFTDGRDGSNPLDGLTIDHNGNLYGTASAGGNQVSGCINFLGTAGCGAVFELARSGSGWILRPLYDFQSSSNGYPAHGVVFGPDGALYGLTNGGSCCGGVFRLAPPGTICRSFTCNWQETVLHQFTGQPDGSGPTSRVLFDSAGNMYGATYSGGAYNLGAAYELSPGNGGWTESVIYSFSQNNQSLGVSYPTGDIAIDQADNLYGAAYCNDTLGCFYGAVFQLQPSQSGWSLNALYQFNGLNGYAPIGVFRDPSGNLYGVTTGAAGNDSGTIYEVSPSNGGWTYSLVYDFGFEDYASGLVTDSAGNLYGVNSSLFNDGYVFKLTPSGSSWTFTTLHTFSGPDGETPNGQLVLDSSGNLYGTTESGGTHGYGVIWEITP